MLRLAASCTACLLLAASASFAQEKKVNPAFVPIKDDPKLPRVLRMNDRLSMAHSRELRVPFLDHRVVEFAFRLDDDKKLRGGEGKAIMRRLLDRKLGGSFGSTPKRAVVTPQREWIRGPLREKKAAVRLDCKIIANLLGCILLQRTDRLC